MSEFSVQSEGIDVERIMEQVRGRIQANRDSDVSDAQARKLAEARAAELLNPGGARTALDGRPQPARASAAPSPTESFDFHHDTIYRSSRSGLGGLVYGIRKLLGPLLKFFFNVQPVVHALAAQSRINKQQSEFDDRVARLFDTSSSRLAAREEIDKLNQRIMQDLVAEMTRLAEEMKNHRMLVESVAARLDFFERQAQARAKESSAEPATDSRGDGTEPARRRRRRGRRRTGRPAAAGEAADAGSNGAAAAAGGAATTGGDTAAASGEAAADGNQAATAGSQAAAGSSTAAASKRTAAAGGQTAAARGAAAARSGETSADGGRPATGSGGAAAASEAARPAAAQPEVKPPDQ